MSLAAFTLMEKFDLIGAGLASNPSVQAEGCGTVTAAATTTADPKGLRILTNNAADCVYGWAPKTGTLLDSANFLKLSDLPVYEVDVTIHSVLPTKLLFGLINTPPTAGGADHETKPGGWRNTDITDLAAFWYENGANGDKWCAVYEGTLVTAKFVTTVAVAINLQFKLRIEVDVNRLVKFYVNETLVHQTSVPLDADAVKPYFLVGGNASIMFNSKAMVAKNYVVGATEIELFGEYEMDPA